MSTERTRPIWFKAKTYGWGWYPATWQGWAVLGVHLVLFVFVVSLGLSASQTWMDQLFYVWIPCIGLTAPVIAIAYLYGEKPRWQWGKPKSQSKS